MRGPSAAVLLAALAVTASCREVEISRSAPAAPDPARAPRDQPAEGPCSAAPSGRLMADVGGIGRMLVSSTPAGSVVAVTSRRSPLVRFVGMDGRGHAAGPERSTSLPQGHSPFLFRATGDAHALLTTADCAGTPCVGGVVVDATGTVRSELAPVPIADALRRSRAASGPGGLVVGIATERAGVDALFVSPEGGLRRETVVEAGSTEQNIDLLAIDGGGDDAPRGTRNPRAARAGGTDYAAILRYGAPEDATSEVHLVTPDSSLAVEALHDAVAIETLEMVGPGRVHAIAAFELSRPAVVELVARGDSVRATATPIPAGEEPPAPFTDAHRGIVAIEAEAVRLHVERASGDPVVRDVVVARRPGATEPAVVRTELGYLVAYVAADGVWTSLVTCEGAAQ